MPKAKHQVRLGSFLADPTRHQEWSQGEDRSTLLCPTVPSKYMSGRGKTERGNRAARGKEGTSPIHAMQGTLLHKLCPDQVLYWLFSSFNHPMEIFYFKKKS